MRDLIETRITELRAEFESGRVLQQELDVRQEEVRRSLLRISGAVQALEELLATASARDAAATDTVQAIPLRRAAEQ
ncbi:MAG TPA: hypothetical protein DGD08_04745 [Gemmatimonas aurantiaca]|uniref:Uncharacterized protein n=2 Tax=Gemmatimonas aurantiaca TaxID=173480 RepID=C1AD92_GEMAT|nr:hypothetical protein [Gemmatimonas aurantiaca]BAH40469.1 hypothetical protein GAU_3427 [Gemmatimonas aurantiaca T-27]HCT56504.1 hypothetical protein [Gemmatimonas aurantiaca]